MADPAITVTTAAGDGSDSVGPWTQAFARINELGTARLEAHNRHAENLSTIQQQSLTDGRHGASWINQKFGVLATEPNAESAGAENTMKAGNVSELTAAAVQNVIGTANAGLASSIDALHNTMTFALADQKSALLPALQSISSSMAAMQASLAVVLANLAAGAPASGAIKQ